jgi:DUF971 family protein
VNSSETAKTAWPTEIRLSEDKRQLTVSYDDGTLYRYTAEFLRVTSPSAEVQGHAPSQRQTVPGKAGITIRAIEPVGNYAIRIHFDDGHHTGIFSWTYLAEIGRDHDRLWADYLADLAAKGLSRER